MAAETKALLALAAVFLAALALRAVNLKKENRGRQFLAACLAPVAALLGVALACTRFDAIAFDPEGRWHGAEVLAWNLLIPAAFLLVKLVLLPVMNRLWADPARMEQTAGRWYEFAPEEGHWFVRLRCRNLRQALNVLAWLCTGIAAVLLAAGWATGTQSPLWLRIYPAAAMLVVTELYNYLAGYTGFEYRHDVDGEDSQAARVSAYSKLRRLYEAMFPAALLTAHTGAGYGGRPGGSDAIRALCTSQDPVDQITGRFFAGRDTRDGLFDVDRVQAANRMMHGENVVILNPFYRDLGEYLLLPMADALVRGRRCLLVVGRSALHEDVAEWAAGLLREYSHTRNLWRVRPLSAAEPDCEVGVLRFSQLYDADVLNANENFFADTGFVLFLEPSRMLVTSQSGIRILSDQFSKQAPPVFCICDHDEDGLVDTMSHLLQTSLTNVVAGPVPHSVHTGLGWAASGDYMRQKLFEKQTHYLGNGVELAAVALKNQVPHITWYSAEKAPVRDIRWLAGQYYPQICRYAHLPAGQTSLEERLSFSSNLWGAASQPEAFVIAEDEFCHLFAVMRAYLTRGEHQCFVNVISENYLLRDYMRCNRQLFLSDPKAVPALAPYYARTERNTVLRLILMMACRPVRESYIAHELSLLGYSGDDICHTLNELVRRYTFADDALIAVQSGQELDQDLTPVPVNSYSIARSLFDKKFASTLKNAFFVVEDEKFDTEHIDARLFGQITQTVMPGQMVTYNGKQYKVHALSPQVGCVLHRAADEYRGRTYYRQLRRYRFEPACEVTGIRRVADIEIARERRDFQVETRAYLAMRDNQDLRTARQVDLSGDPDITAMDRSYKNKTVLRIRLPETTVSMRFTLCMLLGELFRTVFPDAWPYVAVLCVRPEDGEGMLDKIVYRLDGEADEEMIYIVEDSDMDLGMLEAIDSNLLHFFGILADYLTWHFEKMREPPAHDPVLPPIEIPTEEEQVRSRFLAGLAGRLRRMLGLREDEAPAPRPVQEESGAEPAGTETPAPEPPAEAEASPFAPEEEESPAEKERIVENDGGPGEAPEEFDRGEAEESAPTERIPESADGLLPALPEETGPASLQLPAEEQILVHRDGEGLFDADGVPDDLDLLMPIEPSRYQKECFLKFGFDEIDARLDIENVSAYLNVRGWGNNDLTRARRRTELAPTRIDLDVENCCDFCGAPLSGVSYDRLNDGRVRCNECSRTAISRVEEFRELFRTARSMLENSFNITYPVSITVRTTDARTIARHTGQVFRPSTQVAARVLGFAQRKNGRYSLFIENGSPRLAALDTTVHELTHIWQYLNWDDAAVRRIYRQPDDKLTLAARDLVYEGMAMWTSIQLLYALGETDYALQQEQQAQARKDVYGLGFCLYRDRFGLVRTGEEPALHPFASFPPLDPQEVANIFRRG